LTQFRPRWEKYSAARLDPNHPAIRAPSITMITVVVSSTNGLLALEATNIYRSAINGLFQAALSGGHT
jgi:hypothetical protein